MAEEIGNQTAEPAEEIEQTKETQDVGQVEGTEKTGETEKAEPKETIVDKIGSMISAAKNKITGGSNEVSEDIPDDFTNAMQAANYSDEDIIKFAGEGNNGKSFTNEQLIEMIPSLTGVDSAKAEKPTEADADAAKPTEEKIEDSQEGEELKQALARIAVLEEKQGVSEEKSAEEELDSFVGKASDLFDKASEDFEVFGKTTDLPRFPHNGRVIPTSPQMKARNEVFDKAQQLKEVGMPGDKALEFSLNAYKGANLATEIGRKTIRDLKAKEQNLGGKRKSHGVVGGGDNVELSGGDIVKEVVRRHGHDIKN